jgi:hypothetical protein
MRFHIEFFSLWLLCPLRLHRYFSYVTFLPCVIWSLHNEHSFLNTRIFFTCSIHYIKYTLLIVVQSFPGESIKTMDRRWWTIYPMCSSRYNKTLVRPFFWSVLIPRLSCRLQFSNQSHVPAVEELLLVSVFRKGAYTRWYMSHDAASWYLHQFQQSVVHTPIPSTNANIWVAKFS